MWSGVQANEVSMPRFLPAVFFFAAFCFTEVQYLCNQGEDEH